MKSACIGIRTEMKPFFFFFYTEDLRRRKVGEGGAFDMEVIVSSIIEYYGLIFIFEKWRRVMESDVADISYK